MANLIRLTNHTTKTPVFAAIVALTLFFSITRSFCWGEGPNPGNSNHLASSSSSPEIIKYAEQIFAEIADADIDAIPKPIDKTGKVLNNLVSHLVKHRQKGRATRVDKGSISVAPVGDSEDQDLAHVRGMLVVESQEGRRLKDIVIAFDIKVISDKEIQLRNFCFPEKQRLDDLMDEALDFINRVGPLFTAAFNRGDADGIQKLLAEKGKATPSGYGVAFVGDLDLFFSLAKGNLSSITAIVGSTNVSREPEPYGRTNILVKSNEGNLLYKFQLIYKNVQTESISSQSNLSLDSGNENSLPVTMPQMPEQNTDALTVSLATDVHFFPLYRGDTLAAIPRRCRPVLYTLGADRDWEVGDGLKKGVAQVLQKDGKWKTLPKAKVVYPTGVSRGYAPSTVKLGAAIQQNNRLVVFSAGSLFVKEKNLNVLRQALSRWQACPPENRADLAFTLLSESSCRSLHAACAGFLGKPGPVPIIAGNRDRWWKVITDEATDVNTRANVLLRMREMQLLNNDRQVENVWRDLIKTCELRYFEQLVKEQPQTCLSAILDLLGDEDLKKRNYAVMLAWEHFPDEDAVYKRVFGICKDNPEMGIDWCFPLLFRKWHEPSAALLKNELEKATGKKLESLMLSVKQHAAGEYGKVVHESFTSQPRAYTKGAGSVLGSAAFEYAVYYFLKHQQEFRECRSYLKDIQRRLPKDAYLHKLIRKRL